MKRRFVFLGTSFPRDADDHAGRFVYDLGAALAARGHDVHQLAPAAPGLAPVEDLGPRHRLTRFPWSAPAGSASLVYGEGIGPNLRSAPHRALGLPGLWRGMRRALAGALDADPEAIVVSHWALPAGLVAATRARRHRVRRHLGVAHGGGAQLLASWRAGRVLLRRWLAGCDGLLCVSEDLRARVRAAAGADASALPIRVAAMGLDLASFAIDAEEEAEAQRLRRELLGARGEEGVLVAGLGRLIRLKGFDLALEALAGRRDAVVVIAGAGPEAKRLRVQADRLGLALHLPGSRPPRSVRRLLRAADLLVFPGRIGPRGRSEGAPLAVMEALASGTPVVASRVGGVPDLLRDGVEGDLVAPGDVEALRRALAALIRDPERRGAYARAAREGAERFDRARTASALEELLRDVENGS